MTDGTALLQSSNPSQVFPRMLRWGVRLPSHSPSIVLRVGAWGQGPGRPPNPSQFLCWAQALALGAHQSPISIVFPLHVTVPRRFPSTERLQE